MNVKFNKLDTSIKSHQEYYKSTEYSFESKQKSQFVVIFPTNFNIPDWAVHSVKLPKI